MNVMKGYLLQNGKNNVIALSALTLFVILGRVDSSKNDRRVFSCEHDSKFNHLVVDKTHGFVFIGGVNRLYHLDNDLNLIASYKTGPKYDSPECSVRGDCASNVTKSLTNNYNKALVIDYSTKNLRLISCGSIFQGLCQVHNNISNISSQVDQIFESVVANDEKSSTVAFFGSGSSTWSTSSVLYVGATITSYDSPYRMEVPMIASRSLHPNSMLKIAEENVDSGTKLMALPNSYKYFVNYVYGFSSGVFTYFLTTQMKSDSSSYVSKLVRICNEDKKYYSYAEIPIKCTSKIDGIYYNLAQAAFIIIGLDPVYSKLLGLNTNSSDDVLFVVFSQNENHKNNEYNNPSMHSALCVYSLKAINRVFLENIKQCITTGGRRGLENIVLQPYCANWSNATINDDFCKFDFDTQLEGNIPVIEMPLITYDQLILTAVAVVPMYNQIITFFGTNQGHLKKMVVKNASTLIELDDVAMDNSSVNPEMLFDSNMTHLYAMTENKLFRIEIDECYKYKTCKSCVESEDPQCGWCLFGNECTSRNTCANITDDKLSWIHTKEGRCSSIISVIPRTIQRKKTERLEINIDNFPVILSDHHQLQCVFTFSTKTLITNATRDKVVVNCYTPEPYLLPPLKTDDQNLTTKLSLNTTSHPEFVFTNITFFDCGAYISCTACISSPFQCNWCSSKHQCVYSTIQASNVILSSENCDEKEGRRDINYCPVIKSTSDGTNNILISNGTTKSIQFKTIIVAQYLKNKKFSCRFSVEGRMVNVRATWDNKDASILQCDEVEFGYSQRKKNSIVNFDVLWGGWRTLDNLNNIQLMIYKCSEMYPNCVSCLTAEKKYQCGWCEHKNQCEVYSRCKNGSNDWLGPNSTCPKPMILSVKPEYGLWNDQTNITIRGINLGLTVDEVSDITVANLPCIQYNSSTYKSPTEIVCQVKQSYGLSEGPVNISVGKFSTSSKQSFAFVDPDILKFSPKQGPKSGGTELTIEGKYMDATNFTEVMINNITCQVFFMNFSTLKCYTGKSYDCRTSSVAVKFGRSGSTRMYENFSYVDDPVIEKCEKSTPQGIPAGGINIHIRGKNLWSIQKPLFYVYNEDKTIAYYGKCKVFNDSMNCSTPHIPDYLNSFIDPAKPKHLDFGFKMDDVNTASSNFTCGNQTFLLYPNPTFYSFSDKEIMYYNPDRDKYLFINGENIDLACQTNDISVKIGKSDCKIESLKRNLLTCRLPDPNDVISGSKISNVDSQEVIVCVGYFQKNIGRLVRDQGTGWLLYVLYCCAFIVLVATLIILAVSYKTSSKTTRNLKKIRKEMDELELVVSVESKAAFADLLTEITDLTSNITFGGIPFLEYRAYAMNVMFPNNDHSVLSAEKSENIGREEGLRLFGQLINNKTFLLLFIRTIESNENFSLNDRVYVAAMIMMTLQNNMEYCTDILKTLLAELIEKCMLSRSHPKLLLRQSNSVVEKMLSTWFAFLLHKFLKERAGKPLYKLFAAIKQYITKGPIDVITCEARHALSEDKIIRQHIGEYNTITVYISVPSQTALITGLDLVIEEVPVKVLDCDTISQVKDKAIEVIYSNVCYSARPSSSDLELEWLFDEFSGKFLFDDDDSSKVEGEWRQKNTLQHYKVPDCSRFNLVLIKNRTIHNTLTLPVNTICKSHKSSTDTWKPNLFSSTLWKSNKSQLLPGQAKTVNYKPWHLIKPLDFTNIESCQKSSRNDKIVPSEIYLPRLLATKLVLQKFADDLFEAVFDAKLEDNVILSAVKYMFDFLDGQAFLHGITDPDVVHTWKNNCLSLRFWVNLIKNPNFVFDIHKSDIVDSCLNVIAQSFMDSCSTSDHHLCKDSPTTKLLYAKDIVANKKRVKQYYTDIKYLPTISDQDMNAILNEESHLHACEFNTNSSLYALYEYAVKCHDQLMISLKEDEFGQNEKLMYKLGKVHNLIPPELNDL